MPTDHDTTNQRANPSASLASTPSPDPPAELRTVYQRLSARLKLREIPPPTCSGEEVFTPIWWPAKTRFEICAGAILTQNTAWSNVERALANLRAATDLDPACIAVLDLEECQELIRPAGFFRQKSRYLHAIARWFLEWDDVVRTTRPPLEQVRASLLATHGVGPETADDIVLYAYHYPVFILDTYARRLLGAAGYQLPKGYEPARRALQSALAKAQFTAEELAKFHGLIVQAGKQVGPAGNYGALLSPA